MSDAPSPTWTVPSTDTLLKQWDDFDLGDYADDAEALNALVGIAEPLIAELRVPGENIP